MKRQKGITLIALVITIIILLILAGISISALTDSGLFKNAKEAKRKSEEAQNLENEILQDYENALNGYLTDSGNGSLGGNDTEKPKENPIEKVKNQILSATENTTLKDLYNNKIVVPAGFKIKVDEDTNNATTVDKGIVIVDNNENEFVWIPVGTITKSDGSKVEINLNRYTFDSNGVATPQGDAIIDEYFKELSTSTYGNTTAKDIEGFKTSVEKNGGYYIGRYEARTATERTLDSDELTEITENGKDYVYYFITQPDAAKLAQNMYKNVTTFTSDLINSYAWDTATLFLQNCGTNSTYSRQNSFNTSLATKGTNNTEKEDVQCNVYDMASNVYEWTTETSSFYNVYGNFPCVLRGGGYNVSDNYTSFRYNFNTSNKVDPLGFRPILYL